MREETEGGVFLLLLLGPPVLVIALVGREERLRELEMAQRAGETLVVTTKSEGRRRQTMLAAVLVASAGMASGRW